MVQNHSSSYLINFTFNSFSLYLCWCIKQAEMLVEMKVKDGCQTKLGTKPQVRMPRTISWVSTAPSLEYRFIEYT